MKSFRTPQLFGAALLATTLFALPARTQAQASQPGPASLVTQIVDELTHAPLAYASIGVLHQPVGTAADDQGRVRLAVPARYDQDSLRITLVGYAPITVKVAAFRQQLARNGGRVLLRAVPVQLPEVVVTARSTQRGLISKITLPAPQQQGLPVAN
ncbi:hypothetical protein GCM10023185_26230 [Hymenobacter saemangeumensis]|uniref:Carboxypeptidase-like regulatory domain-containing protein n=1 Tax=Hymenobacter saemangeumensis TaxID=1084522 RepID=A0ABP8IJ93_9BACT